MSIAARSYRINKFEITSLDGTNTLDISNSIMCFDYFEDIISPCVTAIAQIINNASLFNILPIRGGEKISLNLSTASGDFELDNEFSLYVNKVTGLDAQHSNESFTLHMISREGLTNETSRCERKYSGNVKNTVISILKDVLVTEKYTEDNIEATSNEYSFISNNRKPFHILTWLGPKSVPITSQKSGTSGEYENAQAQGTAGFLFYENKNGFNFRSMDTLVSRTKYQIGSSDVDDIITYTYTQVIEKNNAANETKILNYGYEKNSDLLKALRVGTYANKTYFYDLYTNKLDIYKYELKSQIKNKLGTEDKIAISEEFGSSISRVMVRISDRGSLNSAGDVSIVDKSGADMSMSISRYNLLFSQALNMAVPCNIQLYVGLIINCQFFEISISNKLEVDSKQSGLYLIKELRHHFELGQMVTYLRLIRDSYGLYGAES